MKKKAVSVICAFVMGACCLPLNTQAKVIEPEVVKTEKWTTSYYIDDDIDTLYPYIQCEADIYNDGTIKLYMWNTHEWDGFATVSHYITIVNTQIYHADSEQLAAKSEAEGVFYGQSYRAIPDTDISNIDISFCPAHYDVVYTKEGCYGLVGYLSERVVANIWLKTSGGGGRTGGCIVRMNWSMPLPEIETYTSRPDGVPNFIIKPNTDPTGTYNFRLYGHDITITPELLSGNVVATPQLTEQEKHIQQLEAENAALKAENVKLKSQISILSTAKFCDVNQDGLVGVEDAQLVLIYYTETIAGLVKDDPIEIWYAKRNTI